jgi:hypothetical protein
VLTLLSASSEKTRSADRRRRLRRLEVEEEVRARLVVHCSWSRCARQKSPSVNEAAVRACLSTVRAWTRSKRHCPMGRVTAGGQSSGWVRLVQR